MNDDSKIWVRDLTKILKKVYKKADTPFPKKPEHGLIDLVEWVSRVPSKSPRRVFKSRELKNKILTPFEIKNLEEIEKTASRGGDLRPFLGDLTRSIRNRISKKNDYFSSDWGLLHLHVGADFENKKQRVSRSKRVLIARFEHENVYFIDIVNHGKGYPDVWGDTSHLEIIYKNWPNVLGKGMLGGHMPEDINYKPTAKEYIKLRNAGITAPVQIDGKSFIPPGLGIATDGSQTQSVQTTLQIFKELDLAESEFIKLNLCGESFLVIHENNSIGFLMPKEYEFFSCFNENDGSTVSNYLPYILSLFSLATDKKFKEFITPKRLKI